MERTDGMNASDVQTRLDDASTPADVDRAVSVMVSMGGVPRYLSTDYWRAVRIRENGHTLDLLVAPDYAALGSSDGSSVYRLARMTPFGAQAYADELHAILPSRKIADAVERASTPRIPFIDVKSHGVPLSQIETPYASDIASELAQATYEDRGLENGSALTFGYKKSIVTGPNLDGSRVAIFGGRWPGWGVVQPYATPHSSGYSDYSHGIMLVSRKAVLDGVRVDLRRDVFGSTDPKIYWLVSDQGRFDPVFPNAGTRSRAEFGASSGGSTGSGSDSSSAKGGTTMTKPGSATKPATKPVGAMSSNAATAVVATVGVAAVGGGAYYLYNELI